MDLGDNKYSLMDIKTNKRLDFSSKYNNFMLYPLENISDCNGNHYFLQLNAYKLMLEEEGKKIKNMEILYINPGTRDIEKYEIPDMEEEVLSIIKHYKSIQEI